jgi:hypothetical protein
MPSSAVQDNTVPTRIPLPAPFKVWSPAVTRVQLSLSGMKTSNCMCNSTTPMKSPYMCIGTKNVCALPCKISALKPDLTHHWNSLLFLSLLLCAKAAGSPIYSCRRTGSGRFCICRESGFLIPQHRCHFYFYFFPCENCFVSCCQAED